MDENSRRFRIESEGELRRRMEVLHWSIDVDPYAISQMATGNHRDWLLRQAASAFGHEMIRLGAIISDEREGKPFGMRRFHFEACILMPGEATAEALRRTPTDLLDLVLDDVAKPEGEDENARRSASLKALEERDRLRQETAKVKELLSKLPSLGNKVTTYKP